MKIAQNIFPLIILTKVHRNLFLKTWFVIISESKGSVASVNCAFLFIFRTTVAGTRLSLPLNKRTAKYGSKLGSMMLMIIKCSAVYLLNKTI